jgi:hypothetical protein
MRSRVSRFAIALTAGIAMVALVPAIAQKGPQSILPPGFGEPDPPPPPPAAPKGSPKSNDDRPTRSSPERERERERDTQDVPELTLRPPVQSTSPSSGGGSIEDIGDDEGGLGNSSGNASVAVAPPQDLPPQARRSLDQVGLLPVEDGGFGPGAFGDADGRYLTTMMVRAKAPIASRWASILLRRALLSQSSIPANINGADWVAHRAWLLVRMGEAENARGLVQRIDSDNYTPWLYEAAMQASLAAADPSAMCGIADDAAAQGPAPAWQLARAMCAGLSGESGTAGSLVSQARNGKERRARGIDVLLAEKVVGAGTNTRRAITIQWDDVQKLTAWRFGLAAAVGVEIPKPLFGTVGPQVQAWAARAPLSEAGARTAFADRAATLGVFSNAALVDLYGAVYEAADPADRGGTTANELRAAYTGDPSARLVALRNLWKPSGDPYQPYARQILSAQAAAMIPTDVATGSGDIDSLVASMMSVGLDIQAARWAEKAENGSLGWAMLAVGAPRPAITVSAGNVSGFGDNELRRQFLFAGLAGLGRLPNDDLEGLAESLEVPIGRQSNWTQALERAVQARQPGTVALLAAVGMQTHGWAYVPPAHLYHIVSALRRVGLEPEARMIAAEALARS